MFFMYACVFYVLVTMCSLLRQGLGRGTMPLCAARQQCCSYCQHIRVAVISFVVAVQPVVSVISISWFTSGAQLRNYNHSQFNVFFQFFKHLVMFSVSPNSLISYVFSQSRQYRENSLHSSCCFELSPSKAFERASPVPFFRSVFLVYTPKFVFSCPAAVL